MNHIVVNDIIDRVVQTSNKFLISGVAQVLSGREEKRIMNIRKWTGCTLCMTVLEVAA